MANYQNFLYLLDQWGLRDVLLPFVIIFTFSFALLQKIQIFKEKDAAGTEKPNKKINVVIAAGIGLAALIPHYTGGGFDIIIFMNNFLPQSFLLLFIVLLFMTLVGSVSDVKPPKQHPLIGMIALVAVVAFGVILLQATQQINYPFLNFLNDPNTQAIVVVALVFILLIWYITKKDTPTQPADYFKKFKERMGEIFG
ncbi:hypothetical protein HY485_05515 [Candidatus Woesearchaeota archaeon]|nr:hypothetical protein [Candidatus Woesearchaeota archaeon]